MCTIQRCGPATSNLQPYRIPASYQQAQPSDHLTIHGSSKVSLNGCFLFLWPRLPGKPLNNWIQRCDIVDSPLCGTYPRFLTAHPAESLSRLGLSSQGGEPAQQTESQTCLPFPHGASCYDFMILPSLLAFPGELRKGHFCSQQGFPECSQQAHSLEETLGEQSRRKHQAHGEMSTSILDLIGKTARLRAKEVRQ